jgi:hypothetical protein
VTIKTELEGVLGPRMAGKLGIEHLVAPVTQRRGSIDALKKIGNTVPAVG